MNQTSQTGVRNMPNVNNSTKLSFSTANIEIYIPASFGIKIVLGILGGVSNVGLFLMCYRRHQLVYSTVSMFILQLAVVWFILSAVIFPSADIVTFRYLFGYRASSTYCVFNMFSNSWGISLSNWTEACLAVNRLVGICLPHQYKRVSSKQVVFSMLAFTWAVTAIAVLPGLFRFGGFFTVVYLNQCTYVTTDWTGDLFQTVVSPLPSCIIGVCGAVILIKVALVARHNRISTLANEGVYVQVIHGRTVKRSTHERRMEVASMLFASYLWGCVCYLPYLVLTTSYRPLLGRYPILIVLIRCFYALQYTLDPLAMIWLNADYKATAQKFLRKLVCRQLGAESELRSLNIELGLTKRDSTFVAADDKAASSVLARHR